MSVLKNANREMVKILESEITYRLKKLGYKIAKQKPAKAKAQKPEPKILAENEEITEFHPLRVRLFLEMLEMTSEKRAEPLTPEKFNQLFEV